MEKPSEDIRLWCESGACRRDHRHIAQHGCQRQKGSGVLGSEDIPQGEIIIQEGRGENGTESWVCEYCWGSEEETFPNFGKSSRATRSILDAGNL